MIRDKNLPCLLGFGGLLLQNHHSLVRNKVADSDVEDFPDATCRPVQDLRDESVFLGEVGLDEIPFLLRKDLGFPRPVDLERNSHWSSRGTTQVRLLCTEQVVQKILLNFPRTSTSNPNQDRSPGHGLRREETQRRHLLRCVTGIPVLLWISH